MASIDLDPSIKQALKFLHFSSRDSTEQVRLLLDEMIKQNCGSAKTMSNVLPKKYLVEDRSEGSQKAKKSDKSHAKISPIQSQSPQRLQILERHDDDSANVMDGELAFDLLQEDLTCAVCRQIAVQAGNRLVECDACHALYHQDCHKPVISDNDVGSGWQCASCLSAQGYPVGNYNMASIRPVPMTSQSNVKTSPMRQQSSSASIKLVTSSSNPASSSSKVITPNINIISADKRLQIMKKKAAKQQEIKRKHVKTLTMAFLKSKASTLEKLPASKKRGVATRKKKKRQ